MSDLGVFARCSLCGERQAACQVPTYDGGLCVNCIAGEVYRIWGDRSMAAVSDFLLGLRRRPLGGAK